MAEELAFAEAGNKPNAAESTEYMNSPQSPKPAKDRIYDAAKAAGFAAPVWRDTLLGALPQGMKDQIPTVPIPEAQLRQDIDWLWDHRALVGGSSPLVSWLERAVTHTKALPHGQAFQDLLDEMKSKVDNPGAGASDQESFLQLIEKTSKVDNPGAGGSDQESFLQQIRRLCSQYRAPALSITGLLAVGIFLWIVFQPPEPVYTTAYIAQDHNDWERLWSPPLTKSDTGTNRKKYPVRLLGEPGVKALFTDFGKARFYDFKIVALLSPEPDVKGNLPTQIGWTLKSSRWLRREHSFVLRWSSEKEATELSFAHHLGQEKVSSKTVGTLPCKSFDGLRIVIDVRKNRATQTVNSLPVCNTPGQILEFDVDEPINDGPWQFGIIGPCRLNYLEISYAGVQP